MTVFLIVLSVTDALICWWISLTNRIYSLKCCLLSTVVESHCMRLFAISSSVIGWTVGARVGQYKYKTCTVSLKVVKAAVVVLIVVVFVVHYSVDYSSAAT